MKRANIITQKFKSLVDGTTMNYTSYIMVWTCMDGNAPRKKIVDSKPTMETIGFPLKSDHLKNLHKLSTSSNFAH